MMIKLVSDIRRKMKRMVKPNPIREWPEGVVSNKFGVERGKPLDRYYIEKFLKSNSMYIKGDVYEIGNNEYTLKYARKIMNEDKELDDNFTSSIFTADTTDFRDNAIIGDLQTGIGCLEECCDCFILTQTLPFIYNVHEAVRNVVKMLKRGGCSIGYGSRNIDD